IAEHKEHRAAVLLDPLDIHWTALQPLRPDGPDALKRQHSLVAKWAGLEVEPIEASVFVPAGYGWQNIDHPGFQEYRIPVNSLTSADWGLLLKTDLVTEPRGRLIDEAYRKVTEIGWAGRAADPNYSIDDLIDCIENDADVAAFYANETRRSVVQP